MNVQQPPFFSVILPTYNRPQLLLTALESIRSQGVPGVEIVVVDDHSDVSYPELHVGDASVKYCKLSRNSGVSAARNHGVRQATADWLVFLDDDDQLAPGYLQFLKERIERDVGAAYGFYWSSVCILGDGQSTRTRTWPTHYKNREHLFSHAISIGASFGFAVRRKLFLDVGGFDPQFRVAEDVELVTKLLAHEALPGYLPYVGTIKNERHLERLSGSPGLYSRENIYERLMATHADFFRAYPACQRSLLLWSAAVHRLSGAFRKELLNLRDLWRLGFRRDLVFYLLSRGKTFRELGFSTND
jgi:glycosyltransferase involved in cell wall biosynthesis